MTDAPTIVQAATDSGLLSAVIVAASVTALVALAMMFVALRTHTGRSGLRGAATAGLALGVVSIAVGGVVAVQPATAQPAHDKAAPYVLVSNVDDVQLPTLAD